MFDSDKDLIASVSLIWFIVLMATMGTMGEWKDNSHKALGSLGNPCFANHTCRDSLKCVDNGSVPGVCVK